MAHAPHPYFTINSIWTIANLFVSQNSYITQIIQYPGFTNHLSLLLFYSLTTNIGYHSFLKPTEYEARQPLLQSVQSESSTPSSSSASLSSSYPAASSGLAIVGYPSPVVSSEYWSQECGKLTPQQYAVILRHFKTVFGTDQLPSLPFPLPTLLLTPAQIHELHRTTVQIPRTALLTQLKDTYQPTLLSVLLFCLCNLTAGGCIDTSILLQLRALVRVAPFAKELNAAADLLTIIWHLRHYPPFIQVCLCFILYLR